MTATVYGGGDSDRDVPDPTVPSRPDLAWWVDKLRYMLGPESVGHSVAGIHAEFAVSTLREYRRARRLTGEGPVVEWLLQRVRPTDTFYDVGANIGTHSCFVGQRADTVHAFEPHPPTADRCRANLRRNDVSGTVHERALAATNETVELTLSRDVNQQLGTGQFTLAETTRPSQRVEVQQVVGDAFVAEAGLPVPDVIKIDVEGAECAVIDGLTHALDNCRVVCCEVHRDRVEPTAVATRLRDRGFTVDPVFARHDEELFLGGLAQRPNGHSS